MLETSGKKIIAILFFLLGAGLVIFFVMNPKFQDTKNQKNITGFEECVKAGYPIIESYPRQCKTKAGKYFVEKIILEK